MLNLPRATENFVDILERQIDLSQEGSNLDKFNKNFSASTSIAFPRPHYTGQSCLVEDYVGDAVPISHYLHDDTAEGMARRRKLAGPLLRAFLKMVFVHNFVHCDIHPGNVLVQKNAPTTASFIDTIMNVFRGEEQSDDDSYTIVFLDAGIVTQLNENDQKNLKDLFKAVILNEGKEAGRLMVERAKYERCSDVEGGIEAFSEGISEIVSEFHDRRKQGLTLGVVNIGTLLTKVLDLCRVYQVEIDPSMANVVMSTIVLEGLGRSLAPDLNLIQCAIPYVL